MIGFSPETLTALRQKFGKQTEKAVERIATRALNKAAEQTRNAASRDMRERYALKAGFVNQRLSIKKATAGVLVAEIRTKKRGLQIARYGDKQLTVQAKRAKGDARRGIAPGRKQAGVSFQILRGAGRKRAAHFFLIPLRRGNADSGNGFGVVMRTGKGRDDYEILYSVSIDQMFRHGLPKYQQQANETLKRLLEAQLRYELSR